MLLGFIFIAAWLPVVHRLVRRPGSDRQPQAVGGERRFWLKLERGAGGSVSDALLVNIAAIDNKTGIYQLGINPELGHGEHPGNLEIKIEVPVSGYRPGFGVLQALLLAVRTVNLVDEFGGHCMVKGQPDGVGTAFTGKCFFYIHHPTVQPACCWAA